MVEQKRFPLHYTISLDAIKIKLDTFTVYIPRIFFIRYVNIRIKKIEKSPIISNVFTSVNGH